MGQLSQVLRALPQFKDARVLVDSSTSDDAGVYLVAPDMALVQTVDFFTPVVDDPYTWGAIAAANSLSDVYAMGATPITALNVAAFPFKTLSMEVIGEVLRGAADKCHEAGVAVLGGHTVEDDVPKFGLAVTGVVDPQKIVRNSAAREGDVLVLTKPLGLGIINSGIKKGVTEPALYQQAVAVMTTLNRAAAAAMLEVGAHAATDITGYGFLGHLYEMCHAAELGAVIDMSRLPVLPGLAQVRAAGATTSAPKQTYAYLGTHVSLDDGLDALQREILTDPQTSGGLLIAVAAADERALHEALQRHGVSGSQTVGRLVAGQTIAVHRTSAD